MNTIKTRNPNLGLYAVAAAIALVGALWFGVPAGTLAFVGIALICPLMMMLMMGGMMGGMHGNGTGTQSHDDTDRTNERDEHSSER
ncbi:hypothetical protein ASC64_17560 [Nocardioides sp. Root122]|uniref:DUF2933 domain-containing protein n=1 Tax=Nocardioides TaxID=1839 RepID=UPI000703B29B|nr:MULTISPECIES: DUF2933 domain-containing protein [Nocardioides]KQV63396.1 hypothetical protein ASC64_17560 [Nocardioides sp. Root122]MCK9826057.1 DUF2933 domain-containing protein [Nocardioides cavernae]